MANYETVIYEKVEDKIFRLTLNRPEKLNSLPWEAHGELARVWLDVDRDPEANVAIIRGAGKAFCAGADLKAVIQTTTSGEDDFLDHAARIFGLLRNYPKPVIAAVNGIAMAARECTAPFCGSVCLGGTEAERGHEELVATGGG